ncbi:MAG: NUDIX hydrolase [Verrucomicrobiota bacterium]
MEDDEVEVLGEGRFLTLLSEGGWECVVQSFAEGTVSVLPLTDAGEVVLVEQYRHPVRSRVIEMPAGMVGDSEEHRGESPEVAVRRELLEEAGCETGELVCLGRGPSSAGITKEVLQLYAATGVRRVSGGGGIGEEAIEVHVVGVGELEDWFAAREAEGKMVDVRVHAALRMAAVRGLI